MLLLINGIVVDIDEQLWIASEGGDVSKVRELLDAEGTDIETRRFGGLSPLFCAIINCHIEIVKLLLDRGADTNAKNIG